MQKVFVILSSDKIGGAEKRFVGLWKSFCEKDTSLSVSLVIDPGLFQLLQRQEDFGCFMKKHNDRVIQVPLAGGYSTFRKAVKQFIHQYTAPGDLLHLIGDHSLLSLHGRKELYSITQSSMKNLNVRGKLGVCLGALLADRIDILDPGIYRQFRRLLFFKRQNISLTTNSFCDTRFFYSRPFREKKDWFVFLGRFEALKQAKKLLSVLPAVHRAIKDIATNDLHFYFYGHGAQEAELKQMLQLESFRHLPVTISFNDRPNEVLARSKVFFSLQWHNNYPSKSLIEAMSAGNIPLVTDVGQTRWLAREEFSYYVPEHFSEADMVKAVTGIYQEDLSVLEEKSSLARDFILTHHTIEKMQAYYRGLYER